MKYQFNQALAIEGQTFLRGAHEVPENVEAHPFFLACIKAGLIGEVDETKIEKKEMDSPQQRAEKLYKKLTAKPEAPKQEKSNIPKESEFPKKKSR